MKRSIKKFTGLTLALAVILSMQAIAFAAVDLNTKGSIDVKVALGNVNYSNVELALYKVGSVTSGDGSTLAYTLTEAFKDSGAELSGKMDSGSMEAAATLRNYATLPADATGKTGADGRYLFTGLDMGVYLIFMTNTGGNSILMNPFLVYLPYLIEGDWWYAVKASPKVAVFQIPESMPLPSEEPETEIPEESTPLNPGESPSPEPSDPGIDIPDESPPLGPGDPPTIEIPDEDPPLAALPQTGLLQWPIPVMAFLGVVLFCLGWMMNNKKKAENEN